MSEVLLFLDLNRQQQAQAASLYSDARFGDGYLYELDTVGHVLSRQLCWFSYEPVTNVKVDRIFLEKALAFMVSIEPDPQSVMTREEANAIFEKYKSAIDKAESIIRLYGQQIEPLDLSSMLQVYEGISGAYSSEPIKLSIVKSRLSSAWNGIGGWMM